MPHTPALTLARETLQRTLQAPSAAQQLQRLNATLAHATLHSPFYRARGLPTQLAQLSDIEQLPYTTKADLRRAYPYGMLALPAAQVQRYAQSTGTSGAASAGQVCAADWQANHLSAAYAWSDLLSAGDVVAVAVPYELSYVGADLDRICGLLGAGVLAIGTNNALCSWPHLLELCASHRVSTLVCAPLRALRLHLLAQEMGLQLGRDLHLQRIICVGEALSEAKRQAIAKLWQVQVFNHYGMTEALAVALPCRLGQLHLAHERLHTELRTASSSLNDGSGELVISTLNQDAMPLLRYRTGDLVRLLPEPCACGRWQPCIQLLGRVQDQLQARTAWMHLSQLDEPLLAQAGLESLFTTDIGPQGLRLNLLPKPDADWSAIETQLNRTLRERWGLRPTLCRQDRHTWLQSLDQRSKPASSPL